ncbi:MAG: DNA polymerase III subunit beta [Planctomycetota bacterium]|nr:DNA polymerase III subunit beta [Planctomycetota bacterium]
MKIQCQARELLEAVSLVSGVVPGNPTRPVLQQARMIATRDGLQVEGTDLEVGLRAQIDEVMVEQEGVCLVPCARLLKVLRESHHPEISFEVDTAGQACITSGSAHFKLPTGPLEEYPSIEFNPPGPSIKVHREKLLQTLSRVSVAAAKDATRFNMHSVLFDGHGEEMRVVSTDGKRMAVGVISISAGGEAGVPEGQYILPLKGVDLLAKILSSETEEEIVLHLDQNEVTYVSDRVSLTCRLVEGKFPEYDRAIPVDLENIYDIKTEDLLIALRQARLMTTKDTNSVRFQFGKGSATLSSSASNVGESRVEFPVERIEGEDDEFAIHFNPEYLIELLNKLDSSQVRCGLRDGKTAGLFSLPDGENSYRHIVMPLVVNEMQEV